MTDVQVSNARRIGFTALALVAFWVLAWREFSISCSDVYQNGISLGVSASGLGAERADPLNAHSAWLVASMTLVPTTFLIASVSNSLHAARQQWVIWSALTFAGAMLLSRWLGLGVSRLDAQIEDAMALANDDSAVRELAATSPRNLQHFYRPGYLESRWPNRNPSPSQRDPGIV